MLSSLKISNIIKKTKFKFLHVTIKILYNLALTHISNHSLHSFESSFYSCSFFHSFLNKLRFYLTPSSFPLTFFQFIICIFYFISFLTILLCYFLQSPYTPLPAKIPTLLSMSMFPFSFCSSPPPPYLPLPLAVTLSCHPVIHESVSILLVSSVCSLDSTYE